MFVIVLSISVIAIVNVFSLKNRGSSVKRWEQKYDETKGR